MMKLSAAIRIGIEKRPNGSDPISTALVGAGLVTQKSAPGEPTRPKRFRLYEHFEGEFIEASFACPVTTCRRRGVIRTILTHANCDHKWTREEIATWLESIGY